LVLHQSKPYPKSNLQFSVIDLQFSVTLYISGHLGSPPLPLSGQPITHRSSLNQALIVNA
ncbi:MAG: hypothetical protein LHW51_12205, partial [Candidatus Cloacimonetes bacterium]|nr:hypothetical protein [Candidatus Cloacimonadota bacterium]MCK9242379.1 hypothetical protein [Candidatus Cloacimonadota bacterium]